MASERDGHRADGRAGAGTDGGGAEGDAPDERVLRETWEAGKRAQGGGSSDEDAISEAAEDTGDAGDGGDDG